MITFNSTTKTPRTKQKACMHAQMPRGQVTSKNCAWVSHKNRSGHSDSSIKEIDLSGRSKQKFAISWQIQPIFQYLLQQIEKISKKCKCDISTFGH